jgi:hypothetical protein
LTNNPIQTLTGKGKKDENQRGMEVCAGKGKHLETKPEENFKKDYVIKIYYCRQCYLDLAQKKTIIFEKALGTMLES